MVEQKIHSIKMCFLLCNYEYTSRHTYATMQLTLGTDIYTTSKLRAWRRAFPFMPKQERQRKNISAPLNTFRTFRNRVFHNESIYWNLCRVEEIHREMITVTGWMNKDVPGWLQQTDRFDAVCRQIRETIQWE